MKEPLTRQSLLTALKAGRTFASEDKNLNLWFAVNGQPMGSVVPDPGTTNVVLEATVFDEDEGQSEYVLEVWRDTIGDGNNPRQLSPAYSLKSGQKWTVIFPHEGATHELFLVHVKQKDSTDDAWSAPVWLDPAIAPETEEHTAPATDDPAIKFVATRTGNVYHYAECKIARKISARTRVEYAEAPAGKRLHAGCPFD